MGLPPWESSKSQWFVMVTGANSGLGYAICERTIAEHFTSPSRPPNQHLVLIISTRAFLKTRDTIAKLRTYLRKFAERSDYAREQKPKNPSYRWQDTVARVHFLGVELDLCDLRKIYNAAAKIRGEGEGLSSPDLLDKNGKERNDGKGRGLKDIQIPRLDTLVMNAGMFQISGLNWGPAVWHSIVDTKETLTWWDHNVPVVGKAIKKQILPSYDDEGNELVSEKEEPPLGEVFCANFFGHYILAHELMSLLNSSSSTNRSPGERGRIIWISSIEALDDSFNISDPQGFQAADPYRSVKRLTDILTLTADLPSVRKVAEPWFKSNDPKKEEASNKPSLYLAHPGIVHTSILELPIILLYCKLIAFYLARWLGSLWHPIQAYKGAVAPTWLVLSSQDTLDNLEGKDGGKTKWGSSTNALGEERVRRTWVPGWGLTGRVGVKEEMNLKGRKRGAVELTREDREDFEVLGREVWTEMERLRVLWEGLLEGDGFDWDD